MNLDLKPFMKCQEKAWIRKHSSVQLYWGGAELRGHNLNAVFIYFFCGAGNA